MIIDDSAVVRKILTSVLSSDPEIEVIASAMNPIFAINKLKKGLIPDVITLDVEMPEMDGVTFLEKLLLNQYIPTIMVSSLTETGAKITVEALRKGAFDFITKPSGNIMESVEFLKNELIPKVKQAAYFAKEKEKRSKISSKNELKHSSLKSQPKTMHVSDSYTGKKYSMIAIGSSTGGVGALEEIIPFLPENSPPVLVVQHMPKGFTKSFAQRLDSISKVRVKEAEDGEPISSGTVFIAPGDYHMELGSGNVIVLHQGEKVNRHRPSVDVLFDSISDKNARNTIGVILTGMGNDGASGMKNMLDKGSYNIAQNEESCVVFGMPKEAIQNGGASKVIALQDIITEINRLTK